MHAGKQQNQEIHGVEETALINSTQEYMRDLYAGNVIKTEYRLKESLL